MFVKKESVAIQPCSWSNSVGFVKDIVAFLEGLKSNVDFHCKRYSEGSLVQPVLLRKIEIEPKVKVEYASKFCHVGDTLCAGGVVGAARARVKIYLGWDTISQFATYFLEKCSMNFIFLSLQVPFRDMMMNEFIEKSAIIGAPLKNPVEMEKLKWYLEFVVTVVLI